ncbi:MAG TPA: ribosome maturation factor RimM [Roseiflexaceae bacterium]|nr:ribosome maturation factor RimM [Roseiflexaceae bacterium]
MTQQSPSPDDTLLIGQIVAPFGVRGQVKLRAYTAHVEHLRRRIRAVYIGDDRREYTLTSLIEHKPGLLILSLGGVTTRDAAEELRGAEVAIRERDAAPLEEGEYFIHQLYDLMVVDEQGAEIGRVREVLETGANEVLVVARPDQPEALIPMIHDVVQELDIPGGRVVVRLIEGLLP